MIRRLSTHLLTILTLVAAVTSVCQAESRSLLTRHTREVTLNHQAPLVGHLPASHSMRIVLVLPVRDQAGLDSFLKDVYDPSSPNFRHFLTVEQFTEKFGPTLQDYETVKQFARNNGFQIAATSRNRFNLDVVGSVSTIEKAFHVSLGIYQHPTEDRTFYAPDREPTTDLSVQLWHISGLDNYSIPKPALMHRAANAPGAISNATTGSCPSKSFCGSDMRAAYYEGTALTGSGQSLGLLEYYGTDLTDLDTYYTNAGQTNNVPITLLSTDGTSTSCKEPSCDDTEQTIDMTQALGMAPGMSSLVMYVGSTDSAIFNSMATASPLNAQLSSSWTWTPPDPNTDNPYFEEFASQGQNLFQAAGDSGGYKGTSPWPTNSVYLTAVGGTDLTTASAGGPWASETVWEDGGGGWGTNIDIPTWQVTAADTCNSEGGDCSKTYRDVPDVAANANFTFYVCADQKACTANEYGGTSFAAPMWAGYLALTNQQYLENGATTTLGFVTPTFYTIGASSGYSSDFHDITSSSNGSNGFTCVAGYNLCGGWGSPNGDNLINALAVVTTSNPSFTVSASPTKITIAKGASGTVTITTAVSGGFDSAITLTATGQGGKQTVTFSPNPIPAPGSGTSTMTIKVGSGATTGNKKITVTATGGGLSETTTVTLDVIN